MGCLGYVDAGGRLVCLVACVGDWVCVVGVFDFLISFRLISYYCFCLLGVDGTSCELRGQMDGRVNRVLFNDVCLYGMSIA